MAADLGHATETDRNSRAFGVLKKAGFKVNPQLKEDIKKASSRP
jgi:hypothetical protein